MAGFLDFMLPASDPNDPNKQITTPDQIARRQAMADALMKQGSDYSPVQSPWQGLARMANAALGGYMNRKGESEAKDANQSNSAALASALLGFNKPAGGAAPAMAPATGSAIPSMAQGGDVPKMTMPNPVSPGLQPQQAALLNAIAAPESGGAYNIRYTPKGGATFAGFDAHPGVFEPGPAGPSSAAGRYQFTKTTWDGMGGGAFTPEMQDQRALQLAQRDYKSRTGGDLMADLQSNGMTPQIAKALSPTWAGLGDHPGKAISAYNSTLQSPGALGAINQAAPGGQPGGAMAYGPGAVPAPIQGSPLAPPSPAAAGGLTPEMLQAYAQRSGMAPAPASDPTGGASLGGAPAPKPNPDVPAPGAVPAGPAPMPPGRDTGNGSYAEPFLEGSPEAKGAATQGQQAQKTVQMQQLMGVLTNPYTTPAQRQIANMVMQKFITPDNVTYQTTPDGTILKMDPKGQNAPTPVYQAPVKKQYGVIGKDQFGTEQYGWIDPISGTTSPNAAAPAAAGATGAAPASDPSVQPIPPAPPGADPKKWREEYTKKQADLTASGGPKMTEGQANANLYASRMEASEKVLRETEMKEGTSTINKGLDYLPGGNMLRSKDAQRFDQAKRDFVNAILRRESGAAISSSEFSNAEKQYFAQPGDGPEVIEQKRQNRAIATEGIRAASGKPAAKTDTTKTDNTAALAKARAAIAGGADPAAVKKRLIENGIDAAGL